MSDLVIEATEVSKSYRDLWRTTRALDGVSVEVEPGTIFGLLGQNGAGKTTLIKILLGLVQPTRGSARVLGSSPGDSRVRRRLGYLPEQMQLPDYFRAGSFLRYMGELNGMHRALLRARIPRVLEQVGLAGIRKRLGSYSKGMRQRLGIAQALLNEPSLFFLDEPAEGLDPVGRKEVRDLLLELRHQGRTIFLNSHLLSEVELVCDQVLILHNGQVVSGGKPDEFRKATGEYRLRVATVNNEVRNYVEAAAPGARWDGRTSVLHPRNRAVLNQMIDGLRALSVEIESLEPIRSTLEQFFIEVIGDEEKF